MSVENDYRLVTTLESSKTPEIQKQARHFTPCDLVNRFTRTAPGSSSHIPLAGRGGRLFRSRPLPSFRTDRRSQERETVIKTSQ